MKNFNQYSNKLKLFGNDGKHFLLLDTLIKFETDLIGFDFFSFKNRTIKINLWRFDDCMEECSMANFQNVAFTANFITAWIYESSKGLNTIFLDKSIRVYKNYIFSIEVDSIDTIALVNSASSISDLQIQNDSILKPLSQNRKFMFRSKVFPGYFYGTTNFNIQYDFVGNYSISIGSIRKNYTVTNQKSMDFMCRSIKDLDLDCYLIVFSQTRENSVLIDFGNCYHKVYSSKNGKFLNHFGPTIPISIENTLQNLNKKSYLLINNEFKYDTILKGFEIYALSKGKIKIKVSLI